MPSDPQSESGPQTLKQLLKANRKRRRRRRRGILRGTLDEAVGTVGRIGGAAYSVGRLGGSLAGSLTGHVTGQFKRPTHSKPGSAPGVTLADLEQMTPTESVEIEVIDFNAERVERTTGRGVETLETERPDWAAVRWVDVRGLHDGPTLAALAKNYKLHPLAMEDVIHVNQRPKVEMYKPVIHAGEGKINTDEDSPPQAFTVLRMLTLQDRVPRSEQVSLLLMGDTVVSIQERSGDCWGGIRQRIETTGTRVRQHDASFLLYALVDAIVDGFFPILEHYSDRLDLLEQEVYGDPQDGLIEDIHEVRRSLLELRRYVWPTRDAINQLMQDSEQLLGEQTQVYLRDVYDHAVQVLDLVEASREMSGSLAETWMSVMSNKMNEVMKVLTIMGSLFLPISFLAGVYGMNFSEIPGASERNGFWWFVGACVVVSIGMLMYFKRKRWI